ncbi:hypothetical protein CSB69_3773 [Morganella morganii]|nr:hypothetical protein CSB69_3773 [Morganella morganii]EMP51829.1 hypothetical protein C790_00728 [Morganella morganii SC01]
MTLPLQASVIILLPFIRLFVFIKINHTENNVLSAHKIYAACR